MSSLVTAVVVTYNRIELLKECVAALRSQTSPLNRIIVVNNSSTDGTKEWIESQADLTAITQDNKGGALGFYTGIKEALHLGDEWIWCMDDDGHPALNALERLLVHKHRKPCVMNALVVNKDRPEFLVFSMGKCCRVMDIPGITVEHEANLFNGTLFHKQVLELVGLPLKNLVIWGDESEFYHRIRYRHRLPIFTVADCLHYHPAQFAKFYRSEWSATADWKVYFFVRNKAFVYRSRYRSALIAQMRYAFFIAAFGATIVVWQKRHLLAKFRILGLAALDGLRLNTDKSISAVRAWMLSSGRTPIL